MDRSKIEDKVPENSRLSPPKFGETSESETNSNNSQSVEDAKEDTFFIYSANMDTNLIWNSKPDYKKSASVPSNCLVNNQDSLNSIWSSKYNSNESLSKQDNGQMPQISIDINEFEMHENNLQSVLNESDADLPIDRKDTKENFTVEDRKKMSTMINSHDGWGVKPVNQNTPWLFPDSEIDNDTYPDTFSTWLNDTPTGACAWEASKKQSGPDWSANAKSTTYATNLATKNSLWSTNNNESIWTNSNVFNNCGAIGCPTKVKSSSNPGFSSQDSNNANYLANMSRVDRTNRVPQDYLKNSCWPTNIRQINEFKSMSNAVNIDRFSQQRQKSMDSDLQIYKQCKDAQKQLVEQYHKEQKKIQDIDNTLGNLSKMSESQSRAILNELIRQRQATQQRLQAIRPQHEAVSQKIIQLEEIIQNYHRSSCGTTTPIDKQFSRPEISNSNMPGLEFLSNKLSSMQVQSSQDFRLDVPEFVPGKKWHGLSQNGKENRNPTVFNKLVPQYSEMCSDLNQESNAYSLTWLYIQNLPSHITMEMIQSFFIQSNNPCIMPIHNNPFSRWMLIKFPNPFSSQKALQLLSGKIGHTSLITDQDANLKLQELKGIMAKFVAHQN